MCLQDLAIARGCTVREISGTFDASEVFGPIDLRRAVLVWGYTTFSGFKLGYRNESGTMVAMPFDAEYGHPDGAAYYQYTPKQFAGMRPGSVFLYGTDGEPYHIFVHEYDAKTDEAIQQLFTR